MEAERWKVPIGDEKTTALWQAAEGPLADCLLVLGHGASTNMEHPSMDRLAAEFRRRGFHTLRFNFLYTERKHGPPDRMPRLMESYAAVVEQARAERAPRHVLIGGHSMGGRTASMLAAEGFACDGVVLLGYPLHPAGQPEKLRSEHLPRIRVPTLCLNGTRDPLCERPLMDNVVEKLPPTWTMHWLEAADHGFRVLKRSGRTDEEVLREIGQTTREWARTTVFKEGQNAP